MTYSDLFLWSSLVFSGFVVGLVPYLRGWLARRPKMHADDRVVSAYLHANGKAFRNDIVSEVPIHRSDIDQALARLCANGIVERDADKHAAPLFRLAEMAESRIGGE